AKKITKRRRKNIRRFFYSRTGGNEMAGLVIDADGHVMEQHQDLFAHIKGNFGEMNWHSTWPMFDADGWQRGRSRKGKREDPDAEAWIRFQNENGIDCAVLYPTSALALGDRKRTRLNYTHT